MQDTATLWVCVNCIMHLANGECGGCHEDDNHNGMPPLGLLAGDEVTMGMAWTEQASTCVYSRLDGPNICTLESQCDCEVNTFSWSQCQGCGSMLGGERHAVTLWL